MAETRLKPVCAAVLAASGAADEVAAAYGVPTKALVPIAGEPVVRRVTRVLNASSLVSRVAVVVRRESPVAEAVADIAQPVETDGSTILDSIDAGLAAFAGEDRILLVTCDVPLLSVEAVDEFLTEAISAQAELVYVIVTREAMVSALPAESRTFVPLRDGYVTGGNLFLISARFARREQARIRAAFAARKNIFALGRLLGWPFLLAFILRRLRLRDVVARAERLLNCKLAVVQSSHPEVAFDMDKGIQVEICRRQVAASPASGGSPDAL